MKNRYIIIPAIIIVILGVTLAFKLITRQNNNAENIVAEVSIPVETSTPEPTATPDPTPKPTIEPISTPETTVEPIVTPEPTEEPIPEPSDIKLTDEERLYNTLAETMGLSVEEVKALLAESESGTSTSAGNTGGGSSNIASENTNQSSANENNFVTPETNTPSNSNPSGSGSSSIIDFESAIETNNAAAGDGGPLTGNVQLNP